MELDPNHMMAAVKLPHPYEHVDGYFIFGSGDVWSAKRGKYLKPSLTPNGYLVVGLSVGGRKARTFFVHRLVAEAFIPLVDGKKRVNHKTETRQTTLFSIWNGVLQAKTTCMPITRG